MSFEAEELIILPDLFLKNEQCALPFFSADFLATLGACVHIVTLQRVLDSDLVQGLVYVAHISHLAPHRVELLQCPAHMPTILYKTIT